VVSFNKLKRKVRHALGAAKVLSREPGAFSFETLPYEWDFKAENRIALINKILTFYDKARYLEIGCFRDACFRNIVAPVKVGVDPQSGGTLRMTSDAYFEQYPDVFDVIFVDGLHTYEQSRIDAVNALKRVPVGGAVLFHDMIPLNWRSARPERIAHRWNGDVWKTAAELAMGRGFDFTIVLADHGVGLAIKTSEDIRYPDLYTEMTDADYRDYVGILKTIHLTGFKDAMAMLDAGKLRAIPAARPLLR
jgi:hypothetical protein